MWIIQARQRKVKVEIRKPLAVGTEALCVTFQQKNCLHFVHLLSCCKRTILKVAHQPCAGNNIKTAQYSDGSLSTGGSSQIYNESKDQKAEYKIQIHFCPEIMTCEVGDKKRHGFKVLVLVKGNQYVGQG